MIAYYNFCKHLRLKYGSSLNTRTMVPLETFKREAGGMLHVHEQDLLRLTADLEILGMAKRRGQYIELAPSLLD